MIHQFDGLATTLGERMDLVNLWGYYAIGGHIRRLDEVFVGVKLQDQTARLWNARFALDALVGDKTVVALDRCRFPAQDLLDFVNGIITTSADAEAVLTPERHAGLKQRLDTFEIVLRNELGYTPAYAVTPKGILSTPKLIDAADQMFDDETRQHLSNVAIGDTKTAGRCLAFDLPTACGFHILRALESVVVGFVVKLTGTAPTKRDLGEYIKTLEKGGADKDVTSVLDQIRRLHRNPLMHPEDVLEPEEAVDLFLLCRSAINATVRDMKKKGYLTAPASATPSLSVPPPVVT